MNNLPDLTSTQWLEIIYDGAEREHPQTLRLCYPRRIIPPQGYRNPKWYGISLYSCSRFWQEPEMNMLPHTTGALMAQAQMKMGVPTYFIGKDYAEAVAQTEPPEDFLLSQIQWPLDAMLFVLPDSFVRQYFGWHVPFLAVARVAAGRYPQDMPVKNDLMYVSRISNPDDRMLLHFPFYLNGVPPVDYTGAYPLTSPISIIQSAPWADATYYEEQLSPFGAMAQHVRGHADAPTPEAEQIMQRKVNAFAIKLLLALTAEPGCMENGTIQRPQKLGRTGKVVKDELWSPNFIGWRFKATRPASTGTGIGTHASPRLHWRRGHMTLQVKGQRSALVPASGLPRFPMTATEPERRGRIDWNAVSPEVQTAFWNTHALKWIKPTLVNAGTP